jgi:hypothetical protein
MSNVPKGLADYKETDENMIEEEKHFSPKYQALKIFQSCLNLQYNGNYPRSRAIFYDSLGWFGVMFDETFPIRCRAIIQRYDIEYEEKQYTYEQIEQLKFMRIVMELSRMLLDASTKKRGKINQDPEKMVELVPVGYSQIFNYEHMAREFFIQLISLQRQQGYKESATFFNHTIPWFGGIFDAKFVIAGYIINNTEENPEIRYRKLVSEFSKLLTRKSITPSAFATLAYKPNATDKTPKSVEDIVKVKKRGKDNESLSAIADKVTELENALDGEATILKTEVDEFLKYNDGADTNGNN